MNKTTTETMAILIANAAYHTVAVPRVVDV
jgi:hypothetical protein